MADISKVRAEATKIKSQLNEELKSQIDALTVSDIQEIILTLEKTGVNTSEVQELKVEVAKATNKNEVITRVLSTPSAICEQIKNIIQKIKI